MKANLLSTQWKIKMFVPYIGLLTTIGARVFAIFSSVQQQFRENSLQIIKEVSVETFNSSEQMNIAA
jgi:hypothetical protein